MANAARENTYLVPVLRSPVRIAEMAMRAGAKLGHSAPRKRCAAAE